MRRLVAVAPEADGLEVGQTLADARALCPGLIALAANAAGDLAALIALATWAERYTPLTAVEVTAGHGLWLDISGCAHLFGGEDALLDPH
jgi:protein ImuB